MELTDTDEGCVHGAHRHWRGLRSWSSQTLDEGCVHGAQAMIKYPDPRVAFMELTDTDEGCVHRVSHYSSLTGIYTLTRVAFMELTDTDEGCVHEANKIEELALTRVAFKGAPRLKYRKNTKLWAHRHWRKWVACVHGAHRHWTRVAFMELTDTDEGCVHGAHRHWRGLRSWSSKSLTRVAFTKLTDTEEGCVRGAHRHGLAIGCVRGAHGH